MFGNKEVKKEQKTGSIIPQNTGHSLNSIVEGTIIEGDVRTESDIRIDGTLIGTLNCQGRVIIGPRGKLDGEVQCENALIEGTFAGNINVRDSLTVSETAHISGDINTDKLVVHSGAVFNVACAMGVKTNENKRNRKPVNSDELISFVEDIDHKS